MPVIAYDPLHMAREEAFLQGLPPVAHKAAYHLIRALREAEDHRVEDDELKLAARFHMPLNQVRQARRWLLARFRLEDGLWSCPLVDEMAALIEHKRRAGSIGGRSRAGNERRSRAALDRGADLRDQEKPFKNNDRVQAPGLRVGALEPGPNYAPPKTPTNSMGEVKLTHGSQESGVSDKSASEEVNGVGREVDEGDVLALAMMGAWNRSVHPVLARGRPARLTNKRRALAEARLADTFGGSLARWEAYLRRIAASSFLTGHRRNSRFLVDLTTALDPEWIARIDEGKYDNAEGETPLPMQRAFTLVSVYERDAADAAAPAAPEVDAAAVEPEPWEWVVTRIVETRDGAPQSWLGRLTCRGLGEDGVVRLEAPSAVVRDRVRDWYASDIRTLWAERIRQAVRAVEVALAEPPAVTAAGAAIGRRCMVGTHGRGTEIP